MGSSEPPASACVDRTPGADPHVSSTLDDLRLAVAAEAWPTRSLALRAGALAVDESLSPSLVHCAHQRYLRGARLWLRISEFLYDTDQLGAVLCLAAQCAAIGGNTALARSCMQRARAAKIRGEQQQRLLADALVD